MYGLVPRLRATALHFGGTARATILTTDVIDHLLPPVIPVHLPRPTIPLPWRLLVDECVLVDLDR